MFLLYISYVLQVLPGCCAHARGARLFCSSVDRSATEKNPGYVGYAKN